MSIFNQFSPADTDSVKQGASQIRNLKATLNTLTSQIFADDLTFLAHWVTNALLSGDPSDANDSLRAVGSDNLKLASVILSKLPDGVFTADTAGRAKFASGFVNSGLLDPAIVFPDGSVTQNAIAAQAVGTTELENLAATIPKVGAGVAKIAIGTYNGSNSAAVSVSGLAFTPTFVVLTAGGSSNRVGIAFKQEAGGNPGPIHSLWDNGNVGSPGSTAITWNSDGFTINASNFSFSTNGTIHSYLAFAV